MKTKSLELALEKLIVKLNLWFETGIEMIPNFFIAILIILLMNIAVKIFSKIGLKLLGKISSNINTNKLIIRFLGLVFFIAGAFIALGILHLDKTVTSLLAGVGILGLAFSFAFQHTAANLLAGIFISVRSSIDVGDLIRSNDHFGNVLQVGLRATKIINVKGQHVEIPNRLIIDNPISEYSQTSFRRIDITGKINFTEDLQSIKELVEKEMATFDFIYSEKSPNMVYNDIEFEKVNFNIRVWMNFVNNDGEFLNARSACIMRLSKLFKENNIEITAQEISVKK